MSPVSPHFYGKIVIGVTMLSHTSFRPDCCAILPNREYNASLTLNSIIRGGSERMAHKVDSRSESCSELSQGGVLNIQVCEIL